MKILLVSTHDNRGGAANVAFRYATELINQGHEVKMYVRVKDSNKDWVIESPKSKLMWKIRFLFDRFLTLLITFKFNASFSLGFFGEGIGEIIDNFNPDIVNFHWINKSFISLKEINRVSRIKPVALSSHDWWYFTEGSHISSSYSDAFKLSTGDILPNLAPRISGWLSKLLVNYKREMLNNKNIIHIVPSKYLLDWVNKSKILSANTKEILYNPLQLSKHLYSDKSIILNKYGLEENKRYIIVGSISLNSDKIKGFDLLTKTLCSISGYLRNNNIGIISFGGENPKLSEVVGEGVSCIHAGYISEYQEMYDLFSVATVYLQTTRLETFSLQAAEAMMSGTSVASFEAGGVQEVVGTQGGKIIKNYDYLALGKATVELLEKPFNREDIIKYASNKYSVKKQTEKLIKLYSDLIRT